jgi:hypothetical protein
MSREQSVTSALKIALFAALIPILMTGCIFSPEKDGELDPPEAPSVIKTQDDLVQSLAESYRTQNLSLFTTLLANDPENKAEYLFILDPAANAGDPQWDYVEEVRVHQRMFEPQSTPPGQAPVPIERWLVSVSITLSPNINFSERTDLYESAQNPTGLDPAKWKATDAVYATDVLFDLQSGNDLQVTGKANFVVIEDLTKEIGNTGKFLLLQWNDLANKPSLGLPS